MKVSPMENDLAVADGSVRAGCMADVFDLPLAAGSISGDLYEGEWGDLRLVADFSGRSRKVWTRRARAAALAINCHDELVAIARAFVDLDESIANEGLRDAVDNALEYYQSQDLADLLNRARKAIQMADASIQPAGGNTVTRENPDADNKKDSPNV